MAESRESGQLGSSKLSMGVTDWDFPNQIKSEFKKSLHSNRGDGVVGSTASTKRRKDVLVGVRSRGIERETLGGSTPGKK